MKLIRESLIAEKSKLTKYFDPKRAMNTQDPYGFYDMANSLDIKEEVLPALRDIGVSFMYDPYHNFIVIFCDDDYMAKRTQDILVIDAEGDRYSENDMDWHLENNKLIDSDSALITDLK